MNKDKTGIIFSKRFDKSLIWMIRFGKENKNVYFCKTLRGGAEVARWAHNPKVIGSNPVPATHFETL